MRRVKAYSSSCSQIVLVHLQPFCRNSLLKCVPQPKIAKINKTPYFESSGSFKVNDVDTTKKLVTSVCCDRQHAHAYLQRYHERLANSGKITTFKEVPLFDALVYSFLGSRKLRLKPSQSMFNAKNFICSLSLSISTDFGAIRS